MNPAQQTQGSISQQSQISFAMRGGINSRFLEHTAQPFQQMQHDQGKQQTSQVNGNKETISEFGVVSPKKGGNKNMNSPIKSSMKPTKSALLQVNQKVVQPTADKKIEDLLSSSDIELDIAQLKIKDKEKSTYSIPGFGRNQTFNPNQLDSAKSSNKTGMASQQNQSLQQKNDIDNFTKLQGLKPTKLSSTEEIKADNNSSPQFNFNGMGIPQNKFGTTYSLNLPLIKEESVQPISSYQMMPLNQQNLQSLNNTQQYYSSQKKSAPASVLGNEQLIEEDQFDTENSGYDVSSVDETLLPSQVLAGSTKLLRFPMKPEVAGQNEVKLMDYDTQSTQVVKGCIPALMNNCVPCMRRNTQDVNRKDSRALSNPYSMNTKIQILDPSMTTTQNLNMADIESSSTFSKNDSLKPISVKGFEVMQDEDARSDYKRVEKLTPTQKNWRFLRKKLLSQVRMRRMAEFFIKMPNLPSEKYIEPSFMGGDCPKLRKMMIKPTNKKLQFFNQILNCLYVYDMIYSITLAFDYKQRYYNLQGQDYIMILFAIDMAMNFFKVKTLDSGYLSDPYSIAAHYLKSQFIFDLIAIIPYHALPGERHPNNTATSSTIRFFKLARITRFFSSSKHLIHFFEKGCANYASWIKKKTVNSISSVLWLMIILTFMCHFLSSAWVYIGLRNESLFKIGWIVRMKGQGTIFQTADYGSLYIVGLYYILTTLSTVGYGDVVGENSNLEFLFQMIVMVIGIGFFAYFMGKMNSLFQGSAMQEIEDEGLDQWLIQLDKSKKNKILEHEIFTGVQKYFSQFSSKDISTLRDHHFFYQLKPRLQKEIFDSLFNDFYLLFDAVFQGTEEEFRRDIMLRMHFEMLQRSQPRRIYLNSIYVSRFKSVVYNKLDTPEYVYFIIKGDVYFTNESGTYHYFKLSSGSYFGDVEAFLGHKSSYSVHFDENSDPVLLLTIKKEKFLRICDKFPESKRVMIEKAQKRRRQFKLNKLKSLVKLMKVLVKNYESGFKKLAQTDQSYLERQTRIIEVYRLLIAYFLALSVYKELLKKEREKQLKQIEMRNKRLQRCSSQTPPPGRRGAQHQSHGQNSQRTYEYGQQRSDSQVPQYPSQRSMNLNSNGEQTENNKVVGASEMDNQIMITNNHISQVLNLQSVAQKLEGEQLIASNLLSLDEEDSQNHKTTQQRNNENNLSSVYSDRTEARQDNFQSLNDRERFQKLRAVVNTKSYSRQKKDQNRRDIVSSQPSPLIDESFDMTEQGYPQDEEDGIQNAIQQTKVKIASAVVAAVKPPFIASQNEAKGPQQTFSSLFNEMKINRQNSPNFKYSKANSCEINIVDNNHAQQIFTVSPRHSTMNLIEFKQQNNEGEDQTQNAQNNKSNNMMNVPLITADSRLITQENQPGQPLPPPIVDKEGHAPGNQGQRPPEKTVKLPPMEEVGDKQKGIQEEEKFEFPNNEDDLIKDNSKLHIAARDKIEEENFSLRNKVNKQHQSTRVLMIQTPDHLETSKHLKNKISQQNTIQIGRLPYNNNGQKSKQQLIYKNSRPNDSPKNLNFPTVESKHLISEFYTQKELRKMDLQQIERELEALKIKLETAIKGVTICNGKKFEVSKNEIVHEFLHDSDDEHAGDSEIVGVLKTF